MSREGVDKLNLPKKRRTEGDKFPLLDEIEVAVPTYCWGTFTKANRQLNSVEHKGLVGWEDGKECQPLP